MLPGHQGTFGLRMRRVLMRMKRKETRNATKTKKTEERVASPPLRLMSTAAIANPCCHGVAPAAGEANFGELRPPLGREAPKLPGWAQALGRSGLEAECGAVPVAEPVA